jgi:sucrose-6-phosphate hydrolase SacC (GH32 family)
MSPNTVLEREGGLPHGREMFQPTVSGPLGPDHQGVVRFRVFLDRSVLEVFAADQACLTLRLYPTREDSLGLSFMVREGSAIVHRLSAWKLAAVWPNQAPDGNRTE